MGLRVEVLRDDDGVAETRGYLLRVFEKNNLYEGTCLYMYVMYVHVYQVVWCL